MEGIIDVYQEYFINLNTTKFHFLKRDTHTCLVCRKEPVRGSYGKFNRQSIQNIIIEYLEHLKIFGFSNDDAQFFIFSIKDSGFLCKKVKGFWEFKEHSNRYVFIIEHCLSCDDDENKEKDFEHKVKKTSDEEEEPFF